MPQVIGQFVFPCIDAADREAEAAYARSWEPTTFCRALHSRVLCVGRTRIDGSWAAYCFPVPGQNHDVESHLWKTDGAKLLEDVARAIFPQFDGVPYAH